MRDSLRRLFFLTVLVPAGLCGERADAQPQPKDLAPPVVDPAPAVTPPFVASLKDVITEGARLYNEKKDPESCYRVFQGGLIAIRPYILDKPALAKHVETSLQKVETMQRPADKAWALRAVLDSVRDAYRPKKAGTQKPTEVLPGPGSKTPIPKPASKPPDRKNEVKTGPRVSRLEPARFELTVSAWHRRS